MILQKVKWIIIKSKCFQHQQRCVSFHYIIYSFIHSLPHEVFIEYLPCASDYSKHWGYTSEQSKAHTCMEHTCMERGLDSVLSIIISKYILWW